jgi:hypothetical protein
VVTMFGEREKDIDWVIILEIFHSLTIQVGDTRQVETLPVSYMLKYIFVVQCSIESFSFRLEMIFQR